MENKVGAVEYEYNPEPVIAGSTNPPPPYQADYTATQPVTQTVILQPVINQALILGKHPSSVTCPSCKVNVITRVKHKSGCGTWLICLGLCIVGLDLGCQFIPFCVDSCKDSHHFCPNCSTFLGRRDLI